MRSAQAAARGEDARIVLKMNALTDEALMTALVRAGQQGARIDLIVRGACMLPPELPGLTDNIRVRSVIGRFLEHSRVFYFRANGKEQLYLSSADWMNRNMLRRIELAWPITDAQLRQRIIDECLVAGLHDQRDAWLLSADGHYQRVQAQRRRKAPGHAGCADGTLRGIHAQGDRMDLILWRHADAEDGDETIDDMNRVLTPRGVKQAARVASWLDRQLPEGTRILCSPARRCEQTVLALGRKYKIRPELAPDATTAQLLEVAQWPSSKQAVLIVGHQPILGETIAQLLPLQASGMPGAQGHGLVAAHARTRRSPADRGHRGPVAETL